MTNQSVLDAIDPHTYGSKAAACSNETSEMFFKSNEPADLIKSISKINKMTDSGLRDKTMDGLLHFNRTGDRAAAEQMIHGYLYLVAHLNLGNYLSALRRHNEAPSIKSDLPELDQIQSYPQHDETREPVFVSMVDVLLETSMPSHAPCAAISAATISI